MYDDERRPVPITFLGTGSAFAPGRMYNGMLLDRRVLLDAPPSLMPMLNTKGIDAAGLEGAFITHAHGDHYFGLPFLFLEHRMRTRRSDPFTIVCPKGMKDLIEKVDAEAYPGLAVKYADRLTVEYVEVEDGMMGNLGDIGYKAFAMSHGEHKALGYLLELRERKIGYSGDTGPGPGLDALVEEAEAVIVEMSMIDAEYPGHMNLKNILELREKVGGDTEIWLTHMDVVPGDVRNRLERAGIHVPDDLGEYTL